MNGPYETVCWIILVSSCITMFCAVAGMLSPRFKDSLFQCLGLAMVALGGFVITLQIYAHGVVQVSGIAFESVGICIYSVATFWKYARKEYGTT